MSYHYNYDREREILKIINSKVEFKDVCDSLGILDIESNGK
tara:strand:- start:3803 stop:3925 length:123 start_codon:yes stop_codon:yes gene_type:complete